MFRYVTLFSLLCAMSLDAAVQAGAVTTATTQRKSRSIWPFSSSDASAESAISEEHSLLLEQAGLDKSFNLSSHPLWKIHKYHGIDLKPVKIQTEIIKSTSVSGGESNHSSSVDATIHTSGNEDIATTSELPDLSFLNDLGGLAAFLPDPEEDEASELIAKAIEKEESSHPGFFKKLWWKLWGSDESSSTTESQATATSTSTSTLDYLSSLFGFGQSQKEAGKEEGNGEDDLTIYLPETQGSYMAVVLPSEKNLKKEQLVPQQNILLPSQSAPPLFRETPQRPTGIELPLAKPVAKWPPTGAATAAAAAAGGSQAWIQSWTPHAAYTVHVQGSSSQRQEPQVEANLGTPSNHQTNPEPSSILEPPPAVETNSNPSELANSWPQVLTQDVPPIFEAFESTRNEQQASRKSSQDFPSSQVAEQEEKDQQQMKEENQENQDKRETGEKNEEENKNKNEDLSSPTAVKETADDRETIKNILSHFRIPEGLMKKLQVSQKDVDSILNDKESASRAADRLRSLQKEFEMRKEQLRYMYATRVKKQLK